MYICQVQDNPSSYHLPLSIDDKTHASDLWSVLNPELDMASTCYISFFGVSVDPSPEVVKKSGKNHSDALLLS